MKIEISYTYQPDKTCPVVVSWTYFDSPLTDPEKLIKKAKTRFKEFQKENGWTKSTKIKEIRLMFEHEESTSDSALDSAFDSAPSRSTGARKASPRTPRATSSTRPRATPSRRSTKKS